MMLRPTATKTTSLSDLLRRASSSSDIFTNYYCEPTSRAPLTFTPDDDDGSGASTPPLWPHSSPDRDQTAASTLYSSLSPASRTQAIARGQMELMEMVKNMPESCYELSLKDLVEVNRRYGPSAKTSSELRQGKGRRMGGQQQQMVRNSSNGGGFLLKMVVPVSWGAKKKKNSRECCVNGSTSLRASPVSDKEWWSSMKRERGSSVSASVESDRSGHHSSLNTGSRKSSTSSSRSSSTNGSTRFEELSDCWSFIRTKKPK